MTTEANNENTNEAVNIEATTPKPQTDETNSNTKNEFDIDQMRDINITEENFKVKYQENTTNHNHNYFIDPRVLARDIAMYVSSSYKEDLAPVISDVSNIYDLSQRKDCAEFVVNYKRSLHIVYAIALSMFEYIPVSDLQNLAESLLQRLEKECDASGNEITTYISAYIPLDNILSIIGAQTYKVTVTSNFENITERCIRFVKSREKIMENMWELFPLMRNAVTTWLTETDFSYSYRNSLSTKFLVVALTNVIKLDFGDSMNRLFPKLLSNEKNKHIVVRVMQLLLEDDSITRKNAIEILRLWATSSDWAWEVSLIIYSASKDELPFTNELKRTIERKIINRQHLRFVSAHMIDSVHLRNIISQILKSNTTDKIQNNDIRVSVYLWAVCNAYRYVNKDFALLPLVAIDNKGQLENIEDVLHKIFSGYDTRHLLFKILDAYLGELSQYSPAERVLNSLKGYFYTITWKSERFNADVQNFLFKLSKNNKLAESILVFLQEKMPIKRSWRV